MVAKLHPPPNLDDLADVSVPAPADGEILYWDDAAGGWRCRAEDIFECGDLAGCSINSLHDVLVTPTNKWIIYFDIGDTKWKAQALSNWNLAELGIKNLDNLDDVNVPVPADGNILYWNDAAGEWQCRALVDADIPASIARDDEVTAAIAAIVLNDLADVNIPMPATLDFIYWDGVAGRWVNISYALLLASIQGDTKLDDLADVEVPTPADGDFLSYSLGLGIWQNRQLSDTDIPDLDTSKITTGTFVMARLPAAAKTLSITYIIDGAGSAIAIGEKGHLEIPFACTIKQVTMLADQSGSIVVDIWKDDYAHFPPTNADSITAAAPPTISAAQKSQDSTLTGWTKSIAAGNILAYNVDSCATITRVTISLKVERS